MSRTVILFDLDGTLIDSTEAIVNSFFSVFDSFALPRPTYEAISVQIGHTLEDMFIALGVQGDVASYVLAYKENYRVVSKAQTFLIENALESVELASSFARLGVVTTKTALYTVPLLEHLGLMDYFEVLVGREDVQNPKPHPEPILKALKHFEGEYDKAWMIGDTCMDIIAAQKAHIDSVAVLTGYADATKLGKCATNMTKDALQAVKIVQNGG